MSVNYLVNMIKKLVSLSLLIMLVNAFEAAAVEVNDLYQASAPVNSQRVSDRKQAIKVAMTNMLIKVSGRKNIATLPEFKKAISKPDSYYLQYRYENKNGQDYLIVDFSESSVNALFKATQQALWGRLRPQVLIWLVQETGLKREIVASSSSFKTVETINQLAKQRGLPVILPLMDLEDFNAVSLPEVWGRFSEPVIEASQRYQAEKVIVVRLSDASLLNQQDSQEDCALLCQQQVAADWTLLSEPHKLGGSYQGSDANKVLTEVVDDIADEIYRKYALSTATNNQFYIDVENLIDLESYVAAFSFLENLSSVQSVVLVEAQGKKRRFKLDVIGTKAALMASLKLSKQLVHQVDPLAGINMDDIPVYFWRN